MSDSEDDELDLEDVMSGGSSRPAPTENDALISGLTQRQATSTTTTIPFTPTTRVTGTHAVNGNLVINVDANVSLIVWLHRLPRVRSYHELKVDPVEQKVVDAKGANLSTMDPTASAFLSCIHGQYVEAKIAYRKEQGGRFYVVHVERNKGVWEQPLDKWELDEDEWQTLTPGPQFTEEQRQALVKFVSSQLRQPFAPWAYCFNAMCCFLCCQQSVRYETLAPLPTKDGQFQPRKILAQRSWFAEEFVAASLIYCNAVVSFSSWANPGRASAARIHRLLTSKTKGWHFEPNPFPVPSS